MNVAFFDLDGTLLDGDTDVLWGQVLSEHGVFDPETTAAFQRGYSSGDLDAEDFVARFLSPLSEHGQEACQPWLREVLEDHAGIRLSSAGDLYADGTDDLLIGSERGERGVGRAYLVTEIGAR